MYLSISIKKLAAEPANKIYIEYDSISL